MLKKCLAVFLVFLTFAGFTQASQIVRVRYVVDGDTLVLDNGRKLRLIGVDTPEIDDKWGRNLKDARHSHRDLKQVQAYAYKAKSFLKSLVQDEALDLETEPANTATGHKDAYGRTLAYLYRRSDRLFINAELVKEGYGFAYTRFPFQYTADFRRYEKEAREHKKGLWA